MTINREHLAPCPFCGGADIIDADYGQEYWCKCRLCGCETGKYGNRFSADEAWNSRAQGAPEAEPVVYAVHANGAGVDHHCPLVSADEAADYMPGCVTPLYVAPPHDADHSGDANKMVDAELVGLLRQARTSVVASSLSSTWFSDLLARIDAKLATLRHV